jgi:hypothetical protein
MSYFWINIYLYFYFCSLFKNSILEICDNADTQDIALKKLNSTLILYHVNYHFVNGKLCFFKGLG